MNIIRSTWLIKTKQIAVLLKRTIHLYSTVPSQIKMLSLPSSFKSSVLISGAWNFRRTKIITSYVSSKFQLFILLNVIFRSYVALYIISKQRIWMGSYFFLWKYFLASIFLTLLLTSMGLLSPWSLVCVNQIRLYFCAHKGLLLLRTIWSPVFTPKVACSSTMMSPARSPGSVPCDWPCPRVVLHQEERWGGPPFRAEVFYRRWLAVALSGPGILAGNTFSVPTLTVQFPHEDYWWALVEHA